MYFLQNALFSCYSTVLMGFKLLSVVYNKSDSFLQELFWHQVVVEHRCYWWYYQKISFIYVVNLKMPAVFIY